eukprot:6036477-Prymnesium_polylepis.1
MDSVSCFGTRPRANSPRYHGTATVGEKTSSAAAEMAFSVLVKKKVAIVHALHEFAKLGSVANIRVRVAQTSWHGRYMYGTQTDSAPPAGH